MMSLPDFTEKKILIVKNKGDISNNLKLKNGNVILSVDGEITNKISCHLVLAVFIIGDCTLTSRLIREFKEKAISLFLLNNSLKTYAEIVSIAEGNYTLRDIQYHMSDEFGFKMAKNLVENKILNQKSLLKEYGKTAVSSLNTNEISLITDTKSLLGTEGSYSSLYFKEIFSDQKWLRRAPTAKEDINNLLLDIGYTFLFNITDSCLRLFGFDTYKGFYHKLFFQRKSLSCDVMEPFRVLIEKSLIKAYNLGKIDEKDFVYKNGFFSFKRYDTQYKYTWIFMEILNDYKDDVYLYCLGLYRYLNNPDKYPFPTFIYKTP